MNQDYFNKMKPPKHGGDIEGFAQKAGIKKGDVMDFSSNINPLGVPYLVRQAYQDSLEDVTKYPDTNAAQLCKRIADFHHVSPENILAGNGSISLIDAAIRSSQAKRALLIEPCFNEYRRLLGLSNVAVDHVLLKPENDFQFPFETILRKLPEVDMLIIGHPNNPTGSGLCPERLIYLMGEAENKGKYIVIDEAFIDWYEEDSMVRQVEKYSSTVVMRSLTKFYALAGIRAGYACAHKDIIQRMRGFQETWSCNSVAQNLAMAALLDKEFQVKSRKWFEEEACFMRESLKKIPAIKVFPSKANFFLCQIMTPSIQEHFWQGMMNSGIYLREGNDFMGLGRNYFRAALKTREENTLLLQKMHELLQEIRNRNGSNILGVYS